MNKILLFIPMYNCEKQIIRVLEQLTTEVCEYLSEAIIVNNMNTDSSELTVKKYLESHDISIPVKLLRNKENYGLGGSHKVAFNYALENNFDYVVVLHGDDQGYISDILPLIKNGEYSKYDCCLGTRFMAGSKLIGYNRLRIMGNYCFNLLFSMVAHKSIKDIGSGLNLYKVKSLRNKYFMKYPDTLYFNALMILASCYYRQNILFYPISWREDDQISNAKLWNLSVSLLKILGSYMKAKKSYMKSDMRTKKIDIYEADVIFERGSDK